MWGAGIQQLSWVVWVQGLPRGCGQDLSQAVVFSEAPLGLKDPVWWLAGLCFSRMSDGGPQLLIAWVLPPGCLSVFKTGQLPPEQAGGGGEPKLGAAVFCRLTLEVTVLSLLPISHRPTLLPREREQHKRRGPRRRQTGYHSHGPCLAASGEM